MTGKFFVRLNLDEGRAEFQNFQPENLKQLREVGGRSVKVNVKFQTCAHLAGEGVVHARNIFYAFAHGSQRAAELLERIFCYQQRDMSFNLRGGFKRGRRNFTRRTSPRKFERVICRKKFSAAG